MLDRLGLAKVGQQQAQKRYGIVFSTRADRLGLGDVTRQKPAWTALSPRSGQSVPGDVGGGIFAFPHQA
jgi:hypothetical protein